MNPEDRSAYRTSAPVLACAAALIGALALIGYAADLPLLFHVRPSFQAMSPLTAVGVLCAAAGVLCAFWRRERLFRAAVTLCALIGTTILGSYLLAGADTLSPRLGAQLSGLAPDQIGRTSIATAISLLCLALALLVRRRHAFAADLASGVVLVISGVGLLGYLYGVEDLYALPVFKSVGLNTAVALALLAAAELLVEPALGWISVVTSQEAAGGATRRQLSFTALPVIAGWLLLGAMRSAALGPGVAMALLVVITIVPLAILILRDGRALSALDTSRREKAEVQTRLTADMEHKLADQAQQLERESDARVDAEAAIYRAQRMEAVGQLTGGIAHDFNNLLMAIRGNLDLMLRRMPAEEERLRRYLDNALAATDKGAKVTAQLLAFSRSQKLDVRPVELEPVLQSARELIGSSLGPQIDIVMALDTAGAWATTDPTQLELAILNLAVNARDAMPDGGVLRIDSGPCRARLGAEADEANYLSVRVIDNGLGMTEEVASHATEPFFTTKERDKGTGLGLAQVYGFVRQCGGDLRIVSAPDAGTSVEILLRCTQAPSIAGAAAGPDAELAPAEGLGRQVLVVDDDAAVRSVIVDALTSAGFQVLEAADGKAGLDLLERAEPVAAVIDFLMPGMNGAEVARLAQGLRPGLPIVFVSGYSDTLALDGITGAVVLRKPFDVRALDRALASVMPSVRTY